MLQDLCSNISYHDTAVVKLYCVKHIPDMWWHTYPRNIELGMYRRVVSLIKLKAIQNNSKQYADNF